MRSRSLGAAVVVAVVSAVAGCGAAVEAGPDPGPSPQVERTAPGPDAPLKVAPWTPEAVAAEPPEEGLTPASPTPAPPPAPEPDPEPEPEPDPAPAGEEDAEDAEDAEEDAGAEEHAPGPGRGDHHGTRDGGGHCGPAREWLEEWQRDWCDMVFD
ncbi:hypothetical protein [Streptomyces sp. enrichment culture]|uniref:hypothetical protein n=1 Tax=Streptomyces sp. enrichment culture TaxID=1795815 RepID=UPI003F5437A3